jgi:hypothetical protein
MLLPNFNDNYKGAAPDVGAYEYGDSLFVTGVGSDTPYASKLASALVLKPGATAQEADTIKPIMTQSAKKDQGDGYDEKQIIPTNAYSALYPNPATNMTTISFSLSQSRQMNIQVFDMTGRLIKTLAEAKMETGAHQLIWDLRDERGRPVNSGIYFVRINSGNSIETKKLSVIGR